MKISLFPLPILALSALTVPEARADFNPAVVSSDARWVVYADLNALRENPVGKEAITLIQQQASHAVPLPGGGSVTLDVPKVLATIGSITAYGANFEKNPQMVDGTLVVEGTPDLRKIVEAVMLELEVGEGPLVSDVKGLGYSAYALAAKDKAHPERNHRVIVGFPPEGMIIVGQSEAKVQQAHDLLLGKGESLAQAHGSDLAALTANAAHATIFAASDVPPDLVAAAAKANAGPHTRILQMTRSASVAVGDEGSKTLVHVQLNASDEESADKLVKILQGMTAMLSLAQSNDQKMTDFINSAQANREGNRVSLQLAYDSGELARMVQGMTAAPHRPNAPHAEAANLEHVLGRRVGTWKAAAPAEGETEAAAPAWQEFPNVKLTNGAQITLDVRGVGANGSVHFDQVQVKPSAGDAAPLTFSRKMMTELRRAIVPGLRGNRLLQIGFPGEDGTYTLRVRYTRPAQGSTTFDLWVKNESGSDNRAGAPAQP